MPMHQGASDWYKWESKAYLDKNATLQLTNRNIPFRKSYGLSDKAKAYSCGNRSILHRKNKNKAEANRLCPRGLCMQSAEK